MRNELLRRSVPGDEAELRSLWKTVFGDGDEFLDAFFELLYEPGAAYLYTVDGRAVSAAYVLRLGDLADGEGLRPCSVIYAFGTLPEYRRRGFGRRILDAAVSDALAAGPVLIVPAEPGLFDYYAKSGFVPYFNAVELSGADSDRDLEGSVTRATVRGYAALREELLHGVPHIDFGIPALSFQERLGEMYRGGLYYVVCGRVRCAAAVEVHDGQAVIRELVAPSASRRDAAELICRATGTSRFTLRSPAGPGEPAQPFAMISPAPEHGTGLAWFGPAFD